MTRDEIIKSLGMASGQMTVTLGAYIAAQPVWNLQVIERVVNEAVKLEREAQIAGAAHEHDEAVSLRATAWQLTVCANRISKGKQV